MLSGKDHVAKLANCHTLNPADPIYQIAQRVLGTDDKSAPGVRRFMQLVGQWGWGCMSQDYPLSIERTLFIDKLCYMGLNGGSMVFKDSTELPWHSMLDFGQSREFWVNLLLARLTQLRSHQQHRITWLAQGGVKAKEFAKLYPEQVKRTHEPLRVAVSSVRYEHELKPLAEHGFQHYLVLCSEETRRERMAAKGYATNTTESVDISEQLARDLVGTMDDRRIIWNDHRSMPEGKSYLSLAEFATLVV